MKVIKTLGKIILGILAGLVALFVLFYVLTIGEYTVLATVAQDPSLPHVTIAGVTYHAETFGDPANPVVITIHGGPGAGHEMFAENPEASIAVVREYLNAPVQ